MNAFNTLMNNKHIIIHETVLVNMLTIISYTLFSVTKEAIFDDRGRLLGEKEIKTPLTKNYV